MTDYTGKRVGGYLGAAGVLAHSGYIYFTEDGMEFKSMVGSKSLAVKYSDVTEMSNCFVGFLPIGAKLTMKDGSSARFGFAFFQLGSIRAFLRSKIGGR